MAQVNFLLKFSFSTNLNLLFLKKSMGVPFLGSIPLDPRIARCCDEGKPFLESFPDSPASVAYSLIIQSKN